MRAVIFEGAGGNEVVRVRTLPDPEPSGSQILVATRYAGLNAADVLQRRGLYPAPAGAPADIPGLEVAGTVAAVGPTVLRWSPGDRVMGLVAGGGLADRVLVDESNVIATPDELDDQLAAAVPEAFMTAHDAVRTQCQLAPGETLLVHGATGGVGSAALQVGLASGASVFGVARSAEGREFVEGLGAAPVADSDFVEELLEATGGNGADVVLELVGAPHFPGNLKALAPQGRIAVVGVGGGSKVEVPLLGLMSARATLRGTVLRSRDTAEKATVVKAFEREMMPFLRAQRLRPIIQRVFPAEDVGEALAHLEGSGKRGKALLEFGE